MSISPFDFVDAIGFSKRDLIAEAESPEQAERDYNSFMVNRALSYHIDAIYYANEMNLRHETEGRLATAFFINTLRKRKRFSKWAKPEIDADLTVVMEYHGYGRTKALEAIRVLSRDQIDEMRSALERGGRGGSSHRSDGGGKPQSA